MAFKYEIEDRFKKPSNKKLIDAYNEALNTNNNVVDNQTDISGLLQPKPTTSPNVDLNLQNYLAYYDDLESKNIPTDINEQAKSTSKTNGTNEQPETDYWALQKAAINNSAINQKAELAAINEKANMYTNAYLKSLGLSGTNAGATNIANNSMALMNANRNINSNAEKAYLDLMEQQRAEETAYKENVDARKQSLINAMINSGARTADVQKAISDFENNPSDENYYSLYTKYANGDDREIDIATIDKALDEGNYDEKTKLALNEIKDKLINASDSEYESLYQQYKNYINHPETAKKYYEEIKAETTNNNNIANNYEVKELYYKSGKAETNGKTIATSPGAFGLYEVADSRWNVEDGKIAYELIDNPKENTVYKINDRYYIYRNALGVNYWTIYEKK